MRCFLRCWVLPLALAAGVVRGAADQAAAAPAPDFQEVYNVARSNLVGLSTAEFNQAALRGLLTQLGAQISLATNDAGAPVTGGPADPPLSKSTLFDEAYGYVRLARVEPGSAAGVAEALGRLGGGKPLKGLVLDLRYATGRDYAAAAQTADLFLREERLLLDWGQANARSTTKSNVFANPAAILVNRQTSGAAEALAAVLRQAEVGLVIGGRTAGSASIFREFPLSTGHRLQVAVAQVKLGDGQPLPAEGLTPDIAVAVSPDEERQYFADAYRTVAKPLASTSRGATNLLALGTNRAGRVNEAELVRMKREGINFDSDPGSGPARPPAPDKPVVTDPALARALDLLKGLAVVRLQTPADR